MEKVRRDAFSRLIDCEDGLVKKVFDSLPHSSLRNSAAVCKSFHRLINSDVTLSWRVSLTSSSHLTMIHSLEDTLKIAPLPSPILLETRRILFNTHRKILLDWLVDVQSEYQLSIETLHTAFILIDRCLQIKQDLQTAHIQLLGASCLFIAAKFCETSHPSLSDLVWVCDHAFTHQQHRDMEMEVLDMTGYDVRSVTPCSCIEALCHLLQQPDAIKAMASYMADLFMLESDSVGRSASCIAAASLLVAFNTVNPPAEGAEDAAMRQHVNVSDLAYATRRSVSEIRLMACKIQQAHLLDYFSNGHGKDIAWRVVRPPPVRQPRLRAVFERHSVVKEVHGGHRVVPPALAHARPIALLLRAGVCGGVSSSGGGGQGQHSWPHSSSACCCWCKSVECGAALQAAFPGFTEASVRAPQ